MDSSSIRCLTVVAGGEGTQRGEQHHHDHQRQHQQQPGAPPPSEPRGEEQPRRAYHPYNRNPDDPAGYADSKIQSGTSASSRVSEVPLNCRMIS